MRIAEPLPASGAHPDLRNSECSSSSISAPARSRSLVISRSSITVSDRGIRIPHQGHDLVPDRLGVGIEYTFFDPDNEKARDGKVFRIVRARW